MERQEARADDLPAFPVRGFGFWIPALVLPLLLLGAAVTVFLLGSGAVAVILGGTLLLGAVSSVAFYSAGVRRRRSARRRPGATDATSHRNHPD
ncbi:MAG: hypothetical protein ABIP92_07875 [Arthrobacter sp.]|uniref:hypothetical protein n=1 Tax=unclassified Arthrobacter TaxID=235627 RepID=UPI001CFF851D|nr:MULTISPECIES: hypothetical protein [unclassified Arthrobacter]MCB5283382.1 hypothetical protein [Arthrobacter sp. ES1]WGZ80782.1 hypothetical protein QI450_06230 [Arthrobacter sp. EM1]